MKKLLAFFMALSLAVLFASCGSNSGNNSSNGSTSEPANKEVTEIKGNVIHILTETSQVSIDSSLVDTGINKAVIMWAYQHPGEKTQYSNEATLTYSAKSFWTESTLIKDLVLINYDQKQQKIISQKFTDKKVKTDWVPLSLFLLLLIAPMFNVLRKNGKEEKILIWSFILCNFALGVNNYPQLFDSIFLGIILALMVVCILLAVGVFSKLVFEAFSANRIPMPHQQDNIGNLVLAYALTCALRFGYFADRPWKDLPLIFLFFLSPYLVAWTVMATKAVIKKVRVKKI